MKSRHGFESEATVKDAHSPSGQTFYAPKSFADLPDCPFCKYGTPVPVNHNYRCIDCGAVMPKEQFSRPAAGVTSPHKTQSTVRTRM